LFIPASNTKLYTTALALHMLGSDDRFHTSLYATRRPAANGVLHGDLVLYGRGDPGLGLDRDGKPTDTWADSLAAALAARGVRRITGNLIADDTWYAGPPYGAGWEAGDLLGGFAPQVSALSVQDNAFTLRIGGNGTCCSARIDPTAAGIQLVNTLQPAGATSSDPLGLYRPEGSGRLYVFGSRPPTRAPRTFTLAAPDPARMAGNLLRQALSRRGIRIDGRVRTRHWPEWTTPQDLRGMIRITDVRSAPLHELIRHMLKQSDNLYAQLLLLAVGKQQAAIGTCPDQQHPPTLTAGWGLCAMRAWLRGIGIDPSSAHFEEGSGLSRKDRVTPAATVQLLAWIDRQPFAADVRKALPIAGVDGTLQYRMRGTLAAGNLRAKTGTLRYAYALSGYVTAANGNRLAFSIMLNGYARPVDATGEAMAPRATHDIDAIAECIARYGTVPLPAPAASAVAGD
jgi:serine-type D-Ala-D-Ala carboxypeptidase/endopeptidase (penicillin-binding protein 4)